VSSQSSHLANPLTQPKIGYDPIKDFENIAILGRQPNALMVHSSLPVKNFQEFIEYVKKRPGQVNYGSAGIGSMGQLNVEMLKAATGIFATHIPYRGGSPLVTAAIGNEVQFILDNLVFMLPHVQSGKVRALVVASEQRLPMLPDVPTMAQAGVPGYQITGWHGIAVRAGTPPAAIDKLNATVNAVFKDPAFRTRWEAIGTPAVGGTAAEFGALIRSDSQRLGALVRSTGVTLD